MGCMGALMIQQNHNYKQTSRMMISLPLVAKSHSKDHWADNLSVNSRKTLSSSHYSPHDQSILSLILKTKFAVD